jgi:hypothetical protein
MRLAHIESWLTMNQVFMLQGQREPEDLNEPNFWILMSQVGGVIKIPLLKRS